MALILLSQSRHLGILEELLESITGTFSTLDLSCGLNIALHLILYSCARFVVSDYDTGIVSSLNPEGTDIKLHTAVVRPMGITVLSDSAANSLATIPLFISALLSFLSAIVFLQL